jgi:tRNA pseudouridine38-40 synthase
MKKSTVRTIYDIDIDYENDVLTMSFTGNGFLYNMVRILSGTLLQAGLGEIAPDSVGAVIASLDRKNAGPTLPSAGLMLERVYY